MPVMDVQRRMRQLGSVRIGYSTPGRSGGKTPARSKTIRLTSPDRFTLERAAEVFGGKVEDFPQGTVDKFLLVTERTEIPIAVTSTEGSQWMEHWDKGSCVLRCNGETVCGPRLSPAVGRPCICKAKYPDDGDRYEAMKSGSACKLTTRISFMIPDVPDIGIWRLDTRGVHAAEELPTTIEILQAALRQGRRLIPCILAIEWRKNVERQPYSVPVIRLQQTINEIIGADHQIEHETAPRLSEGQAQLSAPEDLDEDDNPDDPDGIFSTQEGNE